MALSKGFPQFVWATENQNETCSNSVLTTSTSKADLTTMEGWAFRSKLACKIEQVRLSTQMQPDQTLLPAIGLTSPLLLPKVWWLKWDVFSTAHWIFRQQFEMPVSFEGQTTKSLASFEPLASSKPRQTDTAIWVIYIRSSQQAYEAGMCWHQCPFTEEGKWGNLKPRNVELAVAHQQACGGARLWTQGVWLRISGSLFPLYHFSETKKDNLGEDHCAISLFDSSWGNGSSKMI